MVLHRQFLCYVKREETSSNGNIKPTYPLLRAYTYTVQKKNRRQFGFKMFQSITPH